MRPIFIPYENPPYALRVDVPYEQNGNIIEAVEQWHENAQLGKILECSSINPETLGRRLSAFNLDFAWLGKRVTVECAYQGSKVWENHGPFQDLYHVDSRTAKKDKRLKTRLPFVGYQFGTEKFPKDPRFAFFNWLYLSVLLRSNIHIEQLLKYDAFSDVFIGKGIGNCQGRAAAAAVGLHRAGLYNRSMLADHGQFFEVMNYSETYE